MDPLPALWAVLGTALVFLAAGWELATAHLPPTRERYLTVRIGGGLGALLATVATATALEAWVPPLLTAPIVATASLVLAPKWVPAPLARLLTRVLDAGQAARTADQPVREVIREVLEFGTTDVREIMTPRVDIVAVSTEDTLGEAMATIRKESVSRVPLYGKDLDDIVGMLYAKDLLALIGEDPDSVPRWTDLARPVLYVPVTKHLDDLLAEFQLKRVHLAVVVDEYGGTKGLVTLDDVLEELVGDLGQDSDDDLYFLRRRNGEFIVDAKMRLVDLGDRLGMPLAHDDDAFETLGGLFYHLFERVPELGEHTEFRGLQLAVHALSKQGVSRIRIRSLTPPSA